MSILTRPRRGSTPRLTAVAALAALTVAACSSADASELADRAGEVAADWAGLEPPVEVLGAQSGTDVTEDAPEVLVFAADDPESSHDTTLAGPAASENASPAGPAASENASPAGPRHAFESHNDLGRLFEIDRTGGAVIAREIAGTNRGERALTHGTVVLASASRGVGEQVWVEVSDPSGREGVFGWVPAGSLRATNEVVLDVDMSQAGFFHVLSNVPGGDLVTVRSGPGRSFEAREHIRAGDLVLHGGTTALDADGKRWINIADPAGKVERGWINIEFTSPMPPEITVRNSDGTAVRREQPDGWESGANIEEPKIVGIGCDTIQVEVRSASSHEKLSSHIQYGTERPTAPSEDWQDPQWDMGTDSGIVYIRPGASVIFTLPAPQIDEPLRYYFLQLDDGDSAPTAFDFNGEAIRSEEGDLTATNVVEIRAKGAC